MNNTKRKPVGRLATVLEVIPRGIESPRTVSEISKLTSIPVRNIYDILRVLIMKYDVPIGGIRSNGRHGVFIATNEKERAAALAPLANNAKEIQRRVSKLRSIRIDGDTETKA